MAVVAMSLTRLAEAILTVEILRCGVRDTYFECDPFRSDVIRDINQTHQHKLSQPQSAEVRMHCNSRYMCFINHQAQAAKPNNRSQTGRLYGGVVTSLVLTSMAASLRKYIFVGSQAWLARRRA